MPEGTIELLDRDEFWHNEEDFCQIKKFLNKHQSTAISVTREELQEIVDLAHEKYNITSSTHQEG